MKYKIGDKVRIRKNLMGGNFYGLILFTEPMKRYRGVVGIIKSINKELRTYKILINNNTDSLKWNWSDEMLESCNSSSTWNDKDKYDEKIGILIATARALGFDKETVQGFINVIFKEDDKKKEEPKKEPINKENKSNCHCGKDKCEKAKTCNTKNSKETNKKDIPRKETSKSIDDELVEFLFTIGLLKELF